jgi:hypothetical protein
MIELKAYSTPFTQRTLWVEKSFRYVEKNQLCLGANSENPLREASSYD